MSNLSDTMRRALEECDVGTVRQLWSRVAPHLPQPVSDAGALVCIHRARTEAQSIPLSLRAYSHRWLLDRGWASGLPDELKPKAERLYPEVAAAVGISVRTSPEKRAAGIEIRQAMEDAVLDAEASGRLTDDPFVKLRMAEARAKMRKKLFG